MRTQQDSLGYRLPAWLQNLVPCSHLCANSDLHSYLIAMLKTEEPVCVVQCPWALCLKLPRLSGLISLKTWPFHSCTALLLPYVSSSSHGKHPSGVVGFCPGVGNHLALVHDVFKSLRLHCHDTVPLEPFKTSTDVVYCHSL